jgi:hypothetical protein
LVRPFFFVAVSGVAEGVLVTAAAVAEDIEANAVGGELALFEARRFRGFAGVAGVADIAACALVSSLVPGG